MSTFRILIILTSHAQLGDTGRPTGFYLSEVTHPTHVFAQAGFQVDYASPKGGAAPMDGVDRKDPINATYLDDPAWMARIRATLRVDEVDPSRYDAVFLAGGHGTMWDLPDDAALQALLARTYDAGKVVAAVCHGPAGLVNVKLSDGRYLVAGKQVAGFTDAEEAAVELTDVVPFLLASRLRARGAEVKPAPNFAKNVVVSERLVTGQNPASARGVAEAVVEVLRAARRAP
ncbi:MAG: type 1 glutamine amidotransferase domain-containing protein [Myxococcales bacterium]|nr:type 1 glutamine amidotransferase domain-containing protein [Myxococcales bacterium]